MRKTTAFGWRAASGLLVALGGPAFGHAKLLGSVPAAEARLDHAPRSLTLNFNESVRLAVLELTAAGHAIPLAVDRDAAAAASVTVRLPLLASGTYQVRWSALTPSDGHVVKGTYSFEIR